jgi:hypothetical protein
MTYRKGIRLIFRSWDVDIYNGNINELGDTSWGPRKSFLFFLTSYNPESGLTGERVGCLVEHSIFAVSGAPQMVLENPRELIIFTPSRTHNRSRSPR